MVTNQQNPQNVLLLPNLFVFFLKLLAWLRLAASGTSNGRPASRDIYLHTIQSEVSPALWTPN